MTSTFTFIFHLRTRRTQGRALCFGNYDVIKVKNKTKQTPGDTFSEQQMELVLLLSRKLERAKVLRLLRTVVPPLAHILV